MKEAPYFRRIPPLRRLLWMHKVAGGSSSILKTVTGALLHITDALAKPAKKFVATLEPIQDLHGQDAPYPSGGGKNLLPMTVDNLKLVNTSGTWSGNTYTLNSATFTLNTDDGGNVESITVGGTASARAVFLLWADYEYVADLGLSGSYYISGCPSGGSAGSSYCIALQAEGSGNVSDTGGGVTFDTSSLTNQKYRMIINVYKDNPTTNLVFKPLLCSNSETDKSFAPYSNECPITGHTGANVVRTGKNLYPILSEEKTYTNGGITFTRNSDGSITFSGTATTRVDLDPLEFTYGTGTNTFSLTSGQYTISAIGITVSGVEYIYGGASNTSGLTYGAFNSGHTNPTRTVTLTNDGTTGYNILRVASGTIISDSVTVKIQWERGSTASTYEPYAGTTIPIIFPDAAGTVYGGTLTNEDGGWKLMVDRVMLNSSDIIAKYREYSDTKNLYVAYEFTKNAVTGSTSGTNTADAVSNMFSCDLSWNQMNTNNSYPGKLGVYHNSSWNYTRIYIYLPDSSINSRSTAEAYLTANNVQVSYRLATPIEYTLTESQALTLLKGENNIWVDDSDSLELQYYATAEETTP